MTSIVSTEIIKAVEENDGEIKGSEKLADELNYRNNKTYMLQCARAVRALGELEIVPSNGGRGRMTIYRCPFSKCLHCPRRTCARRPQRTFKRARLPR